MTKLVDRDVKPQHNPLTEKEKKYSSERRRMNVPKVTITLGLHQYEPDIRPTELPYPVLDLNNKLLKQSHTLAYSPNARRSFEKSKTATR